MHRQSENVTGSFTPKTQLSRTTIGILNSRAASKVLELNGGFGSTSSLLHDGEVEYLVWFTVEFDGESVFNVGCVDGYIES